MAYRPRHVTESNYSRAGRDVDHLEAQGGVWGAAPLSDPGSYAIAPMPIAAGLDAQVADQSVWPAYSPLPAIRDQLKVVSDRRLFTPTPDNIPSKKRWAAKFEATKPLTLNHVSSGIKLQASAHVLICIRRKARRAVLLANGKGGVNKKARRTPKSDIWC